MSKTHWLTPQNQLQNSGQLAAKNQLTSQVVEGAANSSQPAGLLLYISYGRRCRITYYTQEDRRKYYTQLYTDYTQEDLKEEYTPHFTMYIDTRYSRR